MVVKRCIPFRDRLELVVEVDDDFRLGHIIMEFHSITAHILLLNKFTAL